MIYLRSGVKHMESNAPNAADPPDNQGGGGTTTTTNSDSESYERWMDETIVSDPPANQGAGTES